MISWIKRHNIVYVILSVFAAILLWLYVVTVEDPDTEISLTNISVVWGGENEILENRNLMIVEGKQATVNLKVRAKRSTTMRLDTEKDKIVITADISDIDSAGDYSRAYRISYPDGILASSVTVLEQYPSRVALKIDKLEARTVDIYGEIVGNIAEGYLAESFIFEPGTLKINGPVDELAGVSHALVTLHRENIENSVTTYLPYVLVDYNGNVVEADFITSDVTEIRTTLPILKTKELALNVDFLSGGGATHENIAWEIEPKVVTVSGPVEIIDDINMITVGAIDLAQVINQDSFSFQILIPNGIQNLSGEMTAEVAVEIRGLESRRLDIDDIVVTNKPQEYEVTPVTRSVNVLIRGPAETVSLIMEHNIRVVADIAELSLAPGSHIVHAKVYIDGYGAAGAVGEYNIAVSVTRK